MKSLRLLAARGGFGLLGGCPSRQNSVSPVGVSNSANLKLFCPSRQNSVLPVGVSNSANLKLGERLNTTQAGLVVAASFRT